MLSDTIEISEKAICIWLQLVLRPRLGLTVLCLSFFLTALAEPGRANTTDPGKSGLCDRAAIEAARIKGVPIDVLQAITRTETGRSGNSGLQPWPWTVNMEGTGRWFATEDEARAYVFAHFKRGARSFDVGCFQINYKWHGAAFRSIDDMFDPILNARYAAEFLTQLHQEFGNWSDAAGAYHSRTPEYARRYTARFDEIRTRLPASAGNGLVPGQRNAFSQPPPNRDMITAQGRVPLFGAGSVAMGSLVPMVRNAGAGPRAFVVIK